MKAARLNVKPGDTIYSVVTGNCWLVEAVDDMYVTCVSADKFHTNKTYFYRSAVNAANFERF